jgi:hypothetical protein
MCGYWREMVAKENMTIEARQQSRGRCLRGGRVATRQPQPWSAYMPDTSGTAGHVTEGY